MLSCHVAIYNKIHFSHLDTDHIIVAVEYTETFEWINWLLACLPVLREKSTFGIWLNFLLCRQASVFVYFAMDVTAFLLSVCVVSTSLNCSHICDKIVSTLLGKSAVHIGEL